VVHANWTLSALAAVLARPIHRRPVVATLQGSDVFQVTRSRLGRWLTASTLRGCDRVLVLSRALAQATARAGIPVDRLTVVPNGVETGRFIPAPEAERDHLILFVGSLIPRKGANTLIAAMPAVLATLPDYRLVILGDGPDEQALREQAAALGIADRIDMQGFLPQAEVVAAMRRARLFVLPSLEEGLGVVLLEALASGTPIVASAVDGIVDVVTQKVGRLVPPAQPAALAEAITAVLSDESGWQAMSRAARLRAEAEYDWDIIAARLVEIYRGIRD
jgi:glycosyltransferase involved in cell wall biosynthesis